MSFLFFIWAACVKPRRKHFGLVNFFRGDKLTSASMGTEGNKNTEMILEKTYKQSIIKEINMINAIQFNIFQRIKAFSFNNKFYSYHVLFLCFLPFPPQSLFTCFPSLSHFSSIPSELSKHSIIFVNDWMYLRSIHFYLALVLPYFFYLDIFSVL